MSVAQSFMPIITVGTYSLLWGPNSIQFDQETNVAIHPILNGQDQSEPVGFTDSKMTMSGFVFSTNNQAMLDAQKFISQPNGYTNRPVAMTVFNQDSSTPVSSQVWYSDVGYLSGVHFEMRGGYGVYKYPFRFSWIQASPQILIPCSDSGDHQHYTFSMSGQASGYIGAVQLYGQVVGLAVPIQQSLAISNNVGSVIGVGPPLGSPANQLFTGNPQVLAAGAFVPNLDWPVRDLALNQSIKTVSPTGTYSIAFNAAFTSPGLPTVYAVYVPL